MTNVLDQLNSQKVVSERKTKTVVEIEFVEDVNNEHVTTTTTTTTNVNKQHVTQEAMLTSPGQGEAL